MYFLTLYHLCTFFAFFRGPGCRWPFLICNIFRYNSEWTFPWWFFFSRYSFAPQWNLKEDKVVHTMKLKKWNFLFRRIQRWRWCNRENTFPKNTDWSIYGWKRKKWFTMDIRANAIKACNKRDWECSVFHLFLYEIYNIHAPMNTWRFSLKYRIATILPIFIICDSDHFFICFQNLIVLHCNLWQFASLTFILDSV